MVHAVDFGKTCSREAMSDAAVPCPTRPTFSFSDALLFLSLPLSLSGSLSCLSHGNYSPLASDDIFLFKPYVTVCYCIDYC